MHPLRLALPSLFAGLLTLSACSGSADDSSATVRDSRDAGSSTEDTGEDFPVSVDSCGRAVTFEQAPERVVTVASVAAPMVAAAGAADTIEARTFETASFLGEYADELAEVPLETTTEEMSREELIALEPDLVITYEGSETTPEDLEAAGIDSYVTRGYCADTAQGEFEEIFADIELLGRLLGTDEAAEDEADDLRRRVDAVEQGADGSESRSAAALIFGRDTPTISAYADRSTVDEQMGHLGLDNVFGDADERYFEVNVEEIIDRDPELIILLTQADQRPADVRQALLDKPELAEVTAIGEEAVIVLPFGYTGPGPVAVEGLEVLAEELDDLG